MGIWREEKISLPWPAWVGIHWACNPGGRGQIPLLCQGLWGTGERRDLPVVQGTGSTGSGNLGRGRVFVSLGSGGKESPPHLTGLRIHWLGFHWSSEDQLPPLKQRGGIWGSHTFPASFRGPLRIKQALNCQLWGSPPSPATPHPAMWGLREGLRGAWAECIGVGAGGQTTVYLNGIRINAPKFFLKWLWSQCVCGECLPLLGGCRGAREPRHLGSSSPPCSKPGSQH